MDLDLFKTVRETVDWLAKKYENITDSKIKKQLSEVGDQISKLAINKAVYLNSLKKKLKLNKAEVDVGDINAALRVAEADTKALNDLLKKYKFTTEQITFNLKHELQELTTLKQIKLEELKDIISKSGIEAGSTEEIITELESFEKKWKKLGKDISKVIAKDK